MKRKTLMKKSFLYYEMLLGLVLMLQAGQSANQSPRTVSAPSELTFAQSPFARDRSPAVRADLDFSRMPLCFIANQGQIDGKVAYYVEGKDKTLYFTPEGMTVVLNADSERWVVKLDFIGANPGARPVGEAKAEAVISYFKGKPQEWHGGLPTYSRISYKDLWPGIDLVYYGTVNRLKSEFIIHPGAEPSHIQLAYRGAERVEPTKEGRLEVTTPAGGFTDDIPVAYQEAEGERVVVPVTYALNEAGDHINAERLSRAGDSIDKPELRPYFYGFDLGDYDRSRQLVLDPAMLVYCGYIGGNGSDLGFGIAVDGSGSAYVTGESTSSDSTFPVAVGPDLSHNGSLDAFVAKVNASGTGLVYCGYIGGSGSDAGMKIAVDAGGNAYIAGHTYSTEATFPVLGGPDVTHNGDGDVFVAKVNASGTALVYCGYIGGSSEEYGTDIAVDGSGAAYVTGYTWSLGAATFPVSVGPDLTHGGSYDAFVAKVNPSGAALVYCGYIGGYSSDYGQGIAVDGAGCAYVTGRTYSTEATFPHLGVLDSTHNGAIDAFVAKVNPSGTGLVYSGYIGGASDDNGTGIAVDGSGNAYIVGNTYSSEATFPVRGGPDLTHNGGSDIFVAKVNSSGSALSYCGYIGGSLDDQGADIALDAGQNALLTGVTSSNEATFPVTVGPDLTYNGGSSDVFVAKVNSSGTALVYCGYIGGDSDDLGEGIAADSIGNAYLTGYTYSTDTTFPVVVGPGLTKSASDDVFVAKVYEEPIWKPRHAVGDFDGDGADEAAVDFGTAGLWLYNDGAWTQLSPSNPESLVAADVDGDTVDEILADLGATGLWLWNAGAWGLLSGADVEGMAAGDIDADGADEMVGDFGAAGIWLYNGGGWTQLSGADADQLACADLDGSGGAEIAGDFGTIGLWIWNAGAWTQLSGLNADYVTFGEANGFAGKELIGDFGATGLWLWTYNSGWTQLSGVNAYYITTMQVDGDIEDEIVGAFGSLGLWFWNDGTCGQSSAANAEFIIAADIDGDGDDDAAADFGSLGLWLASYGSEWIQISGVDPEYLFSADVDGDNQDEILVDFGAAGLWLWNGGSWTKISPDNPE
jgi:hypothetical protein